MGARLPTRPRRPPTAEPSPGGIRPRRRRFGERVMECPDRSDKRGRCLDSNDEGWSGVGREPWCVEGGRVRSFFLGAVGGTLSSSYRASDSTGGLQPVPTGVTYGSVRDRLFCARERTNPFPKSLVEKDLCHDRFSFSRGGCPRWSSTRAEPFV